MIDKEKPDLVIYPEFLKSILAFTDFDLKSYFNIIELTIAVVDTKTNIKSVIINDFYEEKFKDKDIIRVTDTECQSLNNIYLNPDFYPHVELQCSGKIPEYTTYVIKEKTQLKHITEKGPRYVIWKKNELLIICATYIDRVDAHELYTACQRAKSWAYTITNFKSIIVFDLDETLIDYNNNKYKYADELLNCAKNVYDLVVLYSHGSDLHVDDNSQKFKIFGKNQIFNHVLSNNDLRHRTYKNLLHLYNFIPRTRFKTATIVDDSLNATPEYDKIIIPAVKNSLYSALKLIRPY